MLKYSEKTYPLIPLGKDLLENKDLFLILVSLFRIILSIFTYLCVSLSASYLGLYLQRTQVSLLSLTIHYFC